MSAVTYFGLLLCINACFLQDVFGQCASWSLPMEYGTGINEYGCGRRSGFGISSGYDRGVIEAAGAYGGAGTGDLDIAGELPVAGTTFLTGQVPILGAVQFAGEVPSAGVVTISGRCGCDCNGNILY